MTEYESLPTPREIAASIATAAHLASHLPAGVLLQVQDLISTAIARERPAPAESSTDDEDAEPWVMPGDPLDAEPGFYVMFGATCALWEPHEDAAYVAIGLLLRRYGSAPAVRQALLEEQAEIEVTQAALVRNACTLAA